LLCVTSHHVEASHWWRVL